MYKKSLKFLAYVATISVMLLTFIYIFKSKAAVDVWYSDFAKFSDIKINNKLYHNVDTSSFRFNIPDKNNDFELKTGLPKNIKSGSTIVMHSWHSCIEVFAGDDRIYSYGLDRYKNGDMLGSGYHFINIDPRYSGKDIIVKMKTTVNNAYRSMDFFKICKKPNAALYLFYPVGFAIAMSFFMIVFGIIGCMCSLAFFKINRFSESYIFYVFLTSFLAGLWMNSGLGFFQYLTRNYEAGNFIEFASLYLLVFVYILTMSKIKSNKRYDKYFKFVKIIYGGFLIIAFSSHFLRIAYLPDFLFAMHMITVVVMLIIVYVITKNYKEQKLYEKVLLWGSTGSIFLGLLQVLLFNFERYSVKIFGDLVNKIFFVIIASVLIIIFLFTSYIMKLYEIDNYEREIDILKEYAFKDNLTGLSNRESGIKLLTNLVKNKIEYYLIIFDLNDLKKANDIYGHTRGDKLLKDFANCIEQSFPDKKSEKVRYGGDEFLVILRKCTDKDVEKYIKKVEKIIEEKNLKITDEIEISVAYGMANSDEISEYDYEKVLELADLRMYEKKAEMKSKRYEGKYRKGME